MDIDRYNTSKSIPQIQCPDKGQNDVLELLKEQADEIQNLRKENNSILTQFYEWAKEQKNDKIAVLEQKLKEQEDAYSKLAKEYLSLSNRAAHRPNVVRCKDCKHGMANDIGQIQCNMTIGDDDIHEQDWFCADGVAKDINVPDKEGR